jgi:LuxR family maltose regulon positive regulatory protein
VLLAQYAAEHEERFADEATGLLERLLDAAEEGGRTGSVIEILVLQSLASQARGDSPAAVTSLQRALTLSEPEGYIRIFVDEGRPMASLLRAVAKHGIAPSYVRRLLPAVDQIQETAPIQRAMIERLSERELDVLRLLGSDLDGPDIARELVVSLNTVRTHTNAKLGVNNRRAAVRRTQELDLLSRKTRPPTGPVVVPDAQRSYADDSRRLRSLSRLVATASRTRLAANGASSRNGPRPDRSAVLVSLVPSGTSST